MSEYEKDVALCVCRLGIFDGLNSPREVFGKDGVEERFVCLATALMIQCVKLFGSRANRNSGSKMVR